MSHLVLLGDSVFDNGVYVHPAPDVCQQVRELLPSWQVTLQAVDGSVTADVEFQIADLPSNATHLVLSSGGNDALQHQDILQKPVFLSTEAFLLLADALDEFEASYRKTIAAILSLGLPLVVCTIYNANFPDPRYQRCVRVAIAAFNDVILRLAAEHALKAIDLRTICTKPEDYANPIEPSAMGGAKIAQAIADIVTTK